MSENQENYIGGIRGANLVPGAFQENSISIPKYVAVKGGEDAPLANRKEPQKVGGVSKLPSYIKFNLSQAKTTKDLLEQHYPKIEGKSPEATLRKRLIEQESPSGYFNFILQRVDESFQEKHQIVDTFGDSFVGFFFGRRQVILNISGILIDDYMSDMKSELLYLYNNYFRAHHTAKHKVLTEFGYGDTVAQGVFLSLSTGTGDVSNEVQAPFSAQFLVYKFEKPLANMGYYTYGPAPVGSEDETPTTLGAPLG